MNTLEIMTINPSEYGIAESQANELVGNLSQIKAERVILERQYAEILKLDIEDSETSKKAKSLRLLFRDNRTKGINVWHSTTKEFFLKGGQFVDAIKRKEIAINERIEENLEKIEKHFENLEKERKAKLNAERISELEPFNAFVPMGLNFGELSDEEYTKVLNGAKLQFEQQQEEARKAEAERQRQAAILKLQNERKESLLPLWQFVDEKESNFGEMTEEHFASIKSVANSKKADYEAEQEKIRKENERLAAEKKALEEKTAKEKAEAEAKTAKEQERRIKLRPYFAYIRDFDKVINLSDSEFEKELDSLNKQAIDQMRFEAEEKAKAEQVQRELQAKKEAEAKAEQERIAEEKRKKAEADKLAKAPIKKQLNVWVDAFELPEFILSNEKADLIKSKFEAFKKWAISEIESM